MERKEIVRIVKKLDAKLKPTEPAFKVACVLIGATHYGAHEPTLAKVLDIPLADVQVWGERLRKNGVWHGKNINCQWMDPDSGGIAFWLHRSWRWACRSVTRTSSTA